MWRKKPQCIEFFNNEKSIIDHFPIIEAKDLKLRWVKRVKEDFQKHAQEGNTNDPNFIHLSRCPGIFDMFRYGYIISLHKDIIIKLDPTNKKNFKWSLPGNEYQGRVYGDKAFSIGWQSTNLIAKPPWAADFIIKINTGWHVIAPKGVKFLMLPIAYPDTFDFTFTPGILDPAILTEVNFQMFWNATEPETFIRAGTPIVQMIPLGSSDEMKKYRLVQRTMNQQDRDWVEKLGSTYSSFFSRSSLRNKMIDMYNKFWKR